MANTSVHSLPISSPYSHPQPPLAESPPRRRLSKVLNFGQRRSSDAQSDSGAAGVRASVESLGLSRPGTARSHRSVSREGSTRSSTSGSVKRLLPGHDKRERRRIREDELSKISAEDVARGRQPAPVPAPSPASTSNPSLEHQSMLQRPDNPSRSHSSLVTVDSDVESPPAFVSRDSHSGYLTTTSPLITTTAVDNSVSSHLQNQSTEKFPVVVDPTLPSTTSVPTSPKSPALQRIPALPPLPALTDKADSLRPLQDYSRVRGKSPAKRFKDVFQRSGKSPRVSPERKTWSATTSPHSSPPVEPVPPPQGFTANRLSNNPEARGPSPLRAQTLASASIESPKSAIPALQTDVPLPTTPPASILRQPITTVTPPTPTDPENRNGNGNPPTPDYAGSGWPDHSSPSTIGHRRARSQPGLLQQKSKLSSSMGVPLTPTIEEVRTPSGSIVNPGPRNASSAGGFFSSWVSAAQNAATSITSLTNQNKPRPGTSGSDSPKPKLPESQGKEDVPDSDTASGELLKKELAVDTLGSGNLDLSHLGIDLSTERRATSPSRSEFAPGAKDDMAAKMEDILAKRAVSQAYEKTAKPRDATPVAETTDSATNFRPTSTFDTTAGTLTPPNGSIFEGETSGVKRSNSVRSKLHNRRSRNSSVTTAQSTIGAMIGASTATLANPAAGPKLSGFAVAPKQRNRAFHQQFRSVPEDDFLIEDYSCALQKEILLAGRIYISEGHICFSSNILGWVTTLIISFEEVVSIEKENTAIVIPNAIAVQTLHARHTFRSLLSREATYDLMIGIWRVSHPDSFLKSKNGRELAAGSSSTELVATNNQEQDGQDSEQDTSDSDDSDEEDVENDSIGTSGSVVGDDVIESKALSRKPSGGPINALGPTIAASASTATGEATSAVVPVAAAMDGAQDFPGPATHAATECTDSATHYDKIIKDEIIPAPLGKVYALLYGPPSGAWCRKFLLDGTTKAQDLQFEDDKKGLDASSKTRKYQYVKPLGGSIGPKQTTCITMEILDFFDLEKSVSVSCTTLTPDVPSGSAFSTKTRYCLSWAPGNATRFQMNMTIEWTAKSWLKGPIEKGALDGQQQYGEDLIKTLKASLGRSRAQTAGSKVLKNGKKKRKSSKRDKTENAQSEAKKEEDWGAFEILRPFLGPLFAPFQPFITTKVVLTVVAIMVFWMWARGSTTGHASIRAARYERLAHYDQLWQREENDLWEWLQDRTGVDGGVVRDSLKSEAAQKRDDRQKSKQRQSLLKSKDVQNRIWAEKKSLKEMEEAIRMTQERLDSLQLSLEKQRTEQ